MGQLLRKTAKRLGKTQEEVLDEIKTVCRSISTQINFGYYDKEDIEQEGIILGITVLGDYDFERPLANFIYTHVRNRILNLQRKLLTRTDPPCLLCHQSISGHSGHTDGKMCDSYKKWHKLNFTKRSLMEPMELEEGIAKDTVSDLSETKDLITKIDSLLPIYLRASYLRMRAGENVPENIKEQVEDFVRELIYQEEDNA